MVGRGVKGVRRGRILPNEMVDELERTRPTHHYRVFRFKRPQSKVSLLVQFRSGKKINLVSKQR